MNYSHKDVFLLVLNCFPDEAGHFLNYGIKQPFKIKIQDDITDLFSEPIPIDKLFCAKKLEDII